MGLGGLQIDGMHAIQTMDEQDAALMRTFHRQQHLAFQGDAMAEIHRVEHGWLARYTRLPSGQRQITAIYLPGDYCEPQWLIQPTSTEWIVALVDSRTSVIPLNDDLMDCGSNPEQRQDILEDLLRMLGRQSSLAVALGRKSGIERLSSVLLELYERLAETLSQGEVLTMPLTQRDLADIVGLTPIHVNRILKELRENGALDVQRGSVSIVDSQVLRFVAANGYFESGLRPY